jgi:hypothetical protein
LKSRFPTIDTAAFCPPDAARIPSIAVSKALPPDIGGAVATLYHKED